MKLCGCLEKCFVNGEGAWGHMGNILCLYASEKETTPQNIGICGLSGENVDFYCNEEEYMKLTQ